MKFAAAVRVPLEGFAGLPASQAVMDDFQGNLKANDGDSCSRDCSLVVAPLIGVLDCVGEEKVVCTPRSAKFGQIAVRLAMPSWAWKGSSVSRPNRTETV